MNTGPEDKSKQIVEYGKASTMIIGFSNNNMDRQTIRFDIMIFLQLPGAAERQ